MHTASPTSTRTATPNATCASQSGLSTTSRSANPAIVRAAGERLVYLVRSESDPDSRYRVDLEADGFNGVCDCRWFQCQVAPLRRTTQNKTHVCKHIQAVLPYFARQILAEIKAAAIQAYGAKTHRSGP